MDNLIMISYIVIVAHKSHEENMLVDVGMWFSVLKSVLASTGRQRYKRTLTHSLTVIVADRYIEKTHTNSHTTNTRFGEAYACECVGANHLLGGCYFLDFKIFKIWF